MCEVQNKPVHVVGFWSDDTSFPYGPFVLCTFGGYYRIESEMKGHKCPVHVHYSIHRFLNNQEGYWMGNTRRRIKEPFVIMLNEMVERGEIILQDSVWVHPEYL